MTSAEHGNGWAGEPADFRVTWRGFDRDEVRTHVRQLLDTVNEATATRDAAAAYVRHQSAELQSLRQEIESLRQRFDRVCRTPVSTDGLSERLWHMVDLAQREAGEILAESRADAERRSEELDKREAEIEARRAELEAEHQELVRRIETDATTAAEEAARRRREDDERALRRRQDLERDFAKNLAARREELNRALAQREEAAKAEAARIVEEAESRADRSVSEATARVRTLEAARRRVSTELRTARELLAGALPLVEPLPDELAADRTGVVPPESEPQPRATTASPRGRSAREALPTQRVPGPTVQTSP